MLGYLDPKHPYRASKEAQKIMDAADSNNDGVLEVDEFIKVCIGYCSLRNQIIIHNKYQNYGIFILSNS